MTISFATCARHTALEFLQKLYPDAVVEDTPESAGPLLDLVEKDIVRIQDPMMHKPAQVIPGTHWDEELRDAATATAQEFHDSAVKP